MRTGDGGYVWPGASTAAERQKGALWLKAGKSRPDSELSARRHAPEFRTQVDPWRRKPKRNTGGWLLPVLAQALAIVRSLRVTSRMGRSNLLHQLPGEMT